MNKSITLNFYDTKRNCQFPSNYEAFIEKIIEEFQIEERLKSTLFFEIKQNNRYLQIDKNNYNSIENNQEIFIYITQDDLKCLKQENDFNKIKKELVIKSILNKQKEKIKNKNIELLKENNVLGNEIEINIKKIIKEKYQKLKEDILKEKNININNIINESKIVEQFILNFKNNKIKKYEKIIHDSVACNSCGIFPIKGKRFKCCICPSFDLCEKCEKKNNHNHPFFILKKKIRLQ
jgi:hypothetical protein